MKFCRRCGLRLVDRKSCPRCGASRGVALRSARTAEYPPARDLPALVFAYTERTLLGLVERRRESFSYISGTVIDMKTHEDASPRSGLAPGRRKMLPRPDRSRRLSATNGSPPETTSFDSSWEAAPSGLSC